MSNPEIHELNCPDLKGSHRMTWYEWGSSEKIIFCVHGLTRNGRDFDYLAHELAESGYRVICPDIAGRGLSEWLKKPKWYTYPTYVTDILALVKYLGLIKVDWIGTSMGGLIGMIIASQVPNLINKMIINDIGPFIPKESLDRIGDYVGQHHSFDTYDDAENYLKKIMKTFGIKKQEHWEHIIKHTFIPSPDGSYQFAYDPAIGNAFRNICGKKRKMQDMDLWEMWDKITCPMMLLRGAESDLLLKETAERMGRKVDKVVEFEGIGHAPMLMEDEQIKVVKEWL